MGIKEKENYDLKDVVLDWKQTLFSNMVTIMFMGLIALFTLLSQKTISTMQEPNQLIAIIVFMFAIVKMLSMLGQPTIVYRSKTKKEMI
jgi:hypothetical protein